MAQEAASMRFGKRCMETDDRAGTEKIGSRIIETYTRMAALLLELRKVGGSETLDPRSPKVQVVVRAFHEQMEQAARETLGDQAEAFLSRYRALAEGWEDRIPG
jgi:hypothetical protein